MSASDLERAAPGEGSGPDPADGPRPFDPAGPLPTGGVLLEASAGTGKTWSITSLVLRLIVEHDVPIERILAVTFTNAATAELRARVRSRLDEALAVIERRWRADAVGDAGDPVLDKLLEIVHHGAGPAVVLARLRTALEDFDRAQIWTIHGFCQRMLQQNALASGVAFDTTLVEDERALVREVVEDFWQRELYYATPAALALLEGVGLDLAKAVSLGDLAIRHPDAAVVPAEPTPLPPPEMPKTNAARAALERIWWKDRRRALAVLNDALDRGDVHARFPIRELDDVLEVGARVIRGALDRPSFVSLRVLDASLLAKYTRPGVAGPRHPLFDRVSELRAAYIEEMPAAADYLLSFRYRLIAEVRAAVRRRREASAQRSFDDLLRLLREALEESQSGDELARSIRGQFRAVLIDEFQDTDPVQWSIFSRLFVDRPDHWLYLIGDPKQAIYRFRGADIDTYLAAKRALGGRVETLSRSYRSDASLVHAQNLVFDSGPASFATRGIDYERVSAHHQDRAEGLGAALQLRFVRRPGRSKTINAGWRDRELPGRVAADIASALAGGEARLRDTKDGEPRPVRPRDCAVLVRTNKQATAIQDALREVGIPSVLHGPDSVFGTTEAEELERLLAAILEPARTRLARTALATDLLGGTAVAIAEAAADAQRWEAWVGELRAWQHAWQARGIVHLLRTLMAGRLSATLSRVDGERCMANLLHLTELLHNAEVAHELDPAGLLEWLRRARRDASEDDPDASLRLESDAEAVEIVTIHKSKGLEYPLVWCPYLGLPDASRRSEAYLHFRDPDDAHTEKLDVAPERREWAGHKELVAYELAAEGLRLLYVALTRAKHRVTAWWGAFTDAEKSPLWYALHRRGAQVFDAATLSKLREDRTIRGVSDDDLLVDLRALEARADGTIAVVEDTPRKVPRFEVLAASDVDVAPLVYSRQSPIENGWRRTSFTGLTRHVDYHAETAQAAEDETLAEEEGLVIPPDTAVAARRVPLVDLPGGRGTGNFLHEVLEHADFRGSPEALRALVTELLPRHGIDLVWTDVVTSGLVDALAAPFDPADATRLADIPPSRRLNELAFTFPLAHGPITGGGVCDRAPLSPRRLAAVFADHPAPAVPASWIDRLGALSFMPASGFVTGAIDLVYQGHDGRFYVVDYKSNHLGETVADYDRAGMEHAMAAHHYYLQYHLYTVATVRYLRQRLPDFDYDRHFGGVYYLFLRGMSSDHPVGTGVFAARPPRSLIDALSDALDGLGGDLDGAAAGGGGGR